MAFAWGFAVEASPESIYTHFYMFPREISESGLGVDKEKAVASVHVIRPVEILDRPAVLLSPSWKANRDLAISMRRKFRELAEAEYRKHNVITGELSPEIKRDLDTLVSRASAIIAITEPGNPDNLYQLISVAYDGSIRGLPLEERLKGKEFSGLPRHEHKFEASSLRFMEVFGTLEEIGLYSDIMSYRPAVEGEPVEIKTFIKGYQSHEDWVPIILRMMVSMELVRYGVTPLTPEERELKPTAIHYPHHLPKDRYDPRGLTEPRVADYLAEDTHQRTVRIDDIYIEVIGEKLVRLYTGRYGFERTPWSFPDPHLPGQTVFILRSSRASFEDFVVDKLSGRKGFELVEAIGQLTVPSGLDPSRHDGSCLYAFSQLGRHLPTVLGTRGSIIGNMTLR